MFGLFGSKNKADGDAEIPPVSSLDVPAIIPPAKTISVNLLSQQELYKVPQKEVDLYARQDYKNQQPVFIPVASPHTVQNQQKQDILNLPSVNVALKPEISKRQLFEQRQVTKPIQPIAVSSQVNQGPAPQNLPKYILIPFVSLVRALSHKFLANKTGPQFYQNNLENYYIRYPLNRVLEQLPSGQLQLSIAEIADQIPKNFFNPGVEYSKVIMPLNEIVSQLPESVLKEINRIRSQLKTDVVGVSSQMNEPFSQDFEALAGKVPSSTGKNAPNAIINRPVNTLAYLNTEAEKNPAKNELIFQVAAKNLPQEKLEFSKRPGVESQIRTFSEQNEPKNFSDNSFGRHFYSQTAKSDTATTNQKLKRENISPTETPLGGVPQKVSLSPTSDRKPPAIGGPSRLGQHRIQSTTESLAALAELASETSKIYNSGNNPQQLNDVFKKTSLLSAAKATDLIEEKSLHHDLRSLAARPEELKSETQERHTELPPVATRGTNPAPKIFVNPPLPSNKSSNTTRFSSLASKNLEEISTLKSQNPLAASSIPEQQLLKQEKYTHSQRLAAEHHPEAEGVHESFVGQHSSPISQNRTLELPKPILKNNPGDQFSRIAPNNADVDTVFKKSSIRPDNITEQASDASSSTEQKPQFATNIMQPASSKTDLGLEITRPQQGIGSGNNFSLARWLGIKMSKPLPIETVPALLSNSPYIKGAAVVNSEGLTLAAHTPQGLSEHGLGALTLRLYNQAREAAREVGSPFEGQCVVSLGRWTLQITHQAPFYLVTFHDGLDFPPALARRLRKVAAALARQESAV